MPHIIARRIAIALTVSIIVAAAVLEASETQKAIQHNRAKRAADLQFNLRAIALANTRVTNRLKLGERFDRPTDVQAAFDAEIDFAKMEIRNRDFS